MFQGLRRRSPFSAVLDKLFAWRSQAQLPKLPRFRPCFEVLEERQLMTVEFLVNTYTTGAQQIASQSPQAIATDANGNFVVVWQSDGQDGQNFGVFAQRFNAAGVPQGGEFQVNQFTTNAQDRAVVAMDADGDFVISWSSTGQVNSADVFARRYNAAGVAQGDEFQVNTFTTNNQFSSSVAMDDDGDFVITWTSNLQDLSGVGVYGQRFEADGDPVGDEFRVNTTTTDRQEASNVAMDADGDFVVTWSNLSQDGSGYNVFAQRYNAAGTPQGGEFQVNTFTAGTQWTPVVDMDADGDFVIAWTATTQEFGGYGIYAQRYNAAGATQGGEFHVNTFTTDQQKFNRIALDADGDFIIVWQSRTQDDGSLTDGIYAQRYNAAGVPQGGEFRVNTFTTGNQRIPAVAMDADGDFVVAWTSANQDGSGDGVYAKRSGPPDFTSANNTAFTVGSFGTFTVTTTGFPPPAISQAGLPAGLTFTDNGDGTATLAGTPAAGGTYVLTLTASNGISPNSVQDFTLTIKGDVTNKVRLLWPASYLHLGNKNYRGVFTIVNTSSQAINGPIRLFFPTLPPGVSVVSSTTIANLAPGQAATLQVVFHNPVNYPLGNLKFFFKPIVLAG